VHAEQNALLAAARFGIPVEGAVLYSTMRPCFGCTKEMLQAKIQAVYFLHDWAHPDADKQSEYTRLQARFPDGIKRIALDDPDAAWAVSSLRAKGTGPVDETGHQT
jgi:dCMP deaminase